MIERAEKLLARRFYRESVPVFYRRGDRVFPLRAEPGKTLFRADDESGMVIRHESRDFIVRSDDLNLGGPPEIGDEVIYLGKIFRVFAPNNEPCWRYRGRYDLQFLRIHTAATGRKDPGGW